MELRTSNMNVLLIDANSAKCGWAVYDAWEGQVTAAGTIKTVHCTPMGNKKGSAGQNNGSKEEIQAVVLDRWPDVAWPTTALVEDAADAARLAFIAEQKGTLCKQLRTFGRRIGVEPDSVVC